MKIRASDDGNSEVVHKPSMKSQINTSMSRWTILRSNTFIGNFNQISSYEFQELTLFYYKDKAQNKAQTGSP